ncbi:hypothetical protein EYF80_007694 [Liparis tanakae]|uniref:Uncharacterized protein n=1 Tax=Liparis tanakae TaxID=230148 RepID=A0A4Z2IX06_9TELE|nr:hypothetical protein EYF80_007694 [Liparis tanakae]
MEIHSAGVRNMADDVFGPRPLARHVRSDAQPCCQGEIAGLTLAVTSPGYLQAVLLQNCYTGTDGTVQLRPSRVEGCRTGLACAGAMLCDGNQDKRLEGPCSVDDCVYTLGQINDCVRKCACTWMSVYMMVGDGCPQHLRGNLATSRPLAMRAAGKGTATNAARARSGPCNLFFYCFLHHNLFGCSRIGETGKWPNNGQGERVLSLNAHGTGQMICKDCCCWDRAVEEPHNEEKDSRRQGKEGGQRRTRVSI